MLLFALAAYANPVAIADQVDTVRLESTVEALAGDMLGIESRHVLHPDQQIARTWLVDELTAIDGLDVWEEAFTWDGDAELHNIFAELPGDEDLPPVVIGAHFDSTANLEEEGTWNAATDPAPGADDDAAGIAALMEIARVFAGHEPGFRHPVRFAMFNAEEVGLVGSTAHVDGLVERGEDVRLMLQLDPFGYNPAGEYRLWFAYDARWEDEATALEERALQVGSPLTVTGVDEALIGGDERSDHFPYWQAGLPALHLGTFPQPPTYHTVDDTVDVVDPEFLYEGTWMVAAHAAAVAEANEEVPRACGCATGGGGGWAWLLLMLATARRSASRRPTRSTPPG